MRVRRVDASVFERFERTPSGGLRIPATPARVGVQVYKQPDGSDRREYRPADEVFAPGSLATYRGATVTDLHPTERGDAAAVTPDNFRRLVVGHVGDNVAHTDSHVTADVVLHDGEIIRKVEQGFSRELSCGYTCDWDPTPGTSPEGEPYDGVQRRIQINHVALGPPGWARAGESASLRIDAADVLFQPPASPAQPKAPVMKIILDGKEYDKGSDEHLAALDAKAAKAVADEKERADAAEQRAKDLPKRIAARRVFRGMLEQAKDAILARGGRFDAALPSENPDEPEAPDVIRATLAQLVPDFKPAKDDTLFLEGALMAFVHALKSEAGEEPLEDDNYDAGSAMPGDTGPGVMPAEPGRQDRRGARADAEPDAFTARMRMMQSTENAWRRGAGKAS